MLLNPIYINLKTTQKEPIGLHNVMLIFSTKAVVLSACLSNSLMDCHPKRRGAI
jgi:hypothetical protein